MHRGKQKMGVPTKEDVYMHAYIFNKGKKIKQANDERLPCRLNTCLPNRQLGISSSFQ